jgi:intracellular septation protein
MVQKTDDAWRRIDKRKLAERFLVELGPAVAFVVALQMAGLNTATGIFIAAVALAAAYSWFQKKRFPIVPAGMVLLAALFGGLTILLGEAAWIEFRATLVNAAGALAILGGLIFGRLFLKSSLQAGFTMNDGAWWTLSLRMIAYLVVLAAANEVVRLSVSTEIWAWFKASIPILNAGFLALNWPLIRDNLLAEEDAQLTESPPAGPKSAFAPSADTGVA